MTSGDHHLEHDLARHDVDPPEHVEDQLIVALGREHDQRVRHLVGDDADLFLEDGWRPRLLHARMALPPGLA